MLMGLQHLPPATCYLLGMLVTACLGGSSWDEPGFQGRLTNSNSRCQGQLEVYYKDLWSTVCSQSWGQSPAVWRDASLPSKVCHQLLCGEALLLAPISSFNKPRKQIICSGHVGSFSNCSYSRMNCHPLSLICLVSPCRAPNDNTSTHESPTHDHSRAHSSSQGAAGGWAWAPAVCRRGGVLQRRPGWYHQR